jgi:hypothetical protein
MGRITQRVDPAVLDDLLARPARAAIAFEAGGRAEALPVALRRHGGRLWVGIAPENLPAGGAPDLVMLVLDDGRYWFELRAVCLRGRLAEAAGHAPGASPDLAWLELLPERAVAWDYATLHEEG